MPDTSEPTPELPCDGEQCRCGTPAHRCHCDDDARDRDTEGTPDE